MGCGSRGCISLVRGSLKGINLKIKLEEEGRTVGELLLLGVGVGGGNEEWLYHAVLLNKHKSIHVSRRRIKRFI